MYQEYCKKCCANCKWKYIEENKDCYARPNWDFCGDWADISIDEVETHENN